MLTHPIAMPEVKIDLRSLHQDKAEFYCIVKPIAQTGKICPPVHSDFDTTNESSN